MFLLLLLGAGAHAQDNAAVFDGRSDYLELGTLNPSGAGFTVEAWVRYDAVNDEFDTIVEATDINAMNSFFFGYVGDHLQVEIEDINVAEHNSCLLDPIDRICFYTSIIPGRDYHYAVTVHPTRLELYIDGVLADTDTSVSSSPGFGSDLWVLGSDREGASAAFDSDGFDGRMDEVRVWTEVRSAADINCLMDYGLTGSEDELYALYSMDEAGGAASVPDATGSGWDATVQGNTTFTASPFGLTPSVGGDSYPPLD